MDYSNYKRWYKCYLYSSDGNPLGNVYTSSPWTEETGTYTDAQRLKILNELRAPEEQFVSCVIGKLNEKTGEYADWCKCRIDDKHMVDITETYLEIPPLEKSQYDKVVEELEAAGATYNSAIGKWTIPYNEARPCIEICDRFKPEPNSYGIDWTDVETNMGPVPVDDFLEIYAGQRGFDSYKKFYEEGHRISGYENVTPEIIAKRDKEIRELDKIKYYSYEEIHLERDSLEEKVIDDYAKLDEFLEFHRKAYEDASDAKETAKKATYTAKGAALRVANQAYYASDNIYEAVRDVYADKKALANAFANWKNIKEAGFEPTINLWQKMCAMKHLTGQWYTLEDVAKLYRENAYLSNPKTSNIVLDIANECKRQELKQRKKPVSIDEKLVGNEIKNDIRKSGFKPSRKLVSNISKLNAITGKQHKLKDIVKLYRENDFKNNQELSKTVLDIAEECKQQELVRMSVQDIGISG